MMRGSFAFLLALVTAATLSAQQPTRQPRPAPVPSQPAPPVPDPVEHPAPADIPEVVERALMDLPDHLDMARAMDAARHAMEEAELQMQLNVDLFEDLPHFPHLMDLPDLSALSEMHLALADLSFEMPDMHFEMPDMHFKMPDMHFEMPDMHFEMPDMHFEMPEMPLLPDMPPDIDRSALEDAGRLVREELAPRLEEAARVVRDARLPGGFPTEPPAPRYPQDPADSLYKVAREMLNRGEYRRAAETFRLIEQRHPASKYAPDALYWEAFALYRIGTIADMRAALAVLERQREKFPRAARESGVVSLATRIRGELAANGDSRAEAGVRAAAKPSGGGCDREEMAVRLEALNALSKIESDAVLPALRQVLARRDECSTSLRRRAVLLLGRQSGPQAADVLIEVVRNDPDVGVRSEAVNWLGRTPSDASLAVLQDLLVQRTDDKLAATALRALLHHENPRGKQIVRTLIERNDASESLRAEAIGSFSKDNATADDAAFLRAVYPKLESRRLKERVITTVARIPGAENEQWLLGIARGENEPLSLRAVATSRLAASAPVADVVRLYDTIGEEQLKEQLISRLAGRKEPEAVDKLIAIARADADPQLRRAAIARLSQMKDPRTTQLLLEIINQ